MEYTLRNLQSTDLFILAKIIDKIGFKEFKKTLQNDDVKSAIKTLMDNKGEDKTITTADYVAVGGEVAFEIASVILSHLEDVEDLVYTFLSNISNIDKKDIKSLDIVTFTQMLIDVIKKPEFVDFIKVASKLFK